MGDRNRGLERFTMANSSGAPLRDASTTVDVATSDTIGSSREDVRDPEKERSSLLSDMKVTKGSRFNAAERLRRRDRRNTVIVSFASAYVIVLTVIPVIFHVPEYISSIITIAVIIFSIVILTYSLIQYSSGDPVKAEQNHRCAMEINAMRRRLSLLPDVTFENLSLYAKDYDDILQRYNVNHEPVDFETYKIEHPTEYPLLSDKEAIQKDVNKETNFYRTIMASMFATIVLTLLGILANYVLAMFKYDMFHLIK